MTEPKEELDCMKCGACCVYFAREKEFYPIQKDDPNAERLLDIGYGYRSRSGEMFMRRKRMKTHRRCIALFGGRGEQVTCKCYDQRPEMCREFEIGGDLCREARKAVLGHE